MSGLLSLWEVVDLRILCVCVRFLASIFHKQPEKRVSLSQHGSVSSTLLHHEVDNDSDLDSCDNVDKYDVGGD